MIRPNASEQGVREGVEQGGGASFGLGSRPSDQANLRCPDASRVDPSRGQVFDFRRQGWGHAIHMPSIETRTVEPSRWRRLFGAKPERFQFMTCMGHSTPMPGEGDVLLIPMKSGKTARWRVIEIRYLGNPDDMFDVLRADFEGYLASDSDGSPKGGDACGSVHDSAAPSGDRP